ncbi:MAG: hypothetical protein FWG20_02935 [Candidatus Cloacimonetes bacterium]|nr:hypothetical protein [Candidatus Cloacimonadota bacterium]
MFDVKNDKWHDSNGAYPMNIFRIVLADKDLLDDAIDALSNEKGIIFAEKEAINRYTFTPNDPQFSLQWHLTQILCPQMWDTIQDASEIIIAVIDTGVKWNHHDLRDNIYIDQSKMPGISIDWRTGTITRTSGNPINYDYHYYSNDVFVRNSVFDGAVGYTFTACRQMIT